MREQVDLGPSGKIEQGAGGEEVEAGLGQLGALLTLEQSRLHSCLIFQIASLSDQEKLSALQLRARNRGMELSDSVADYILQRAERSLASLMLILEQLDQRSLAEQRRLTIPLVKSTLGW